MMSALYIGATGMKCQAEGLNVISNNLANVNTVAYKQTSAQFADLLSGYVTAGSSAATGVAQQGSGAWVAETRTLFTQGSLESTTQVTDVAVAGLGWFGVQQNGETRYTRAGNFAFTKNGALVDANGWTVMGRLISNGVEASSAGPIELDFSNSGVGSMAGQASSEVRSISNLGGLTDNTADTANPFFALAASWDGTASEPLASGSYAYSSAFTFYDADGTLRGGTIYYDQAGSSGGMSAVEYVVAIDPGQDGSNLAGTQAAGLLMAGTLTFNSSGELVNMTAFTPPDSGDPADLSGWAPAASTNGLPQFSVTFSGGESQNVGLNLGLTLSGDCGNGLQLAADAAGNPAAIYSANAGAVKGANASTAYGDTQYGITISSDGHATGDLVTVSIASDGVISGSYSNGQTQDLCRLTLYRFTSEDGLQKEGNGQYSATTESGVAEEGTPGDENFGTVQQYALEQSNVDYATEFSNLIITQRAFQMNSKVITTTDTMLQKALELKR